MKPSCLRVYLQHVAWDVPWGLCPLAVLRDPGHTCPPWRRSSGSRQGGLGVVPATRYVHASSREGMDGHGVGVLCPLRPWVGVLDKPDIPKGSSGFSVLFHDQYAERITWGCQGCTVRAVILQWTSSGAISASPAHLELPSTLKTPAWGCQAEWRVRLCGEQRVLCAVP